MRLQVLYKKGFTLVELLVVIGIIALLISILLPALNKARESAKVVQCLNNARTMAQAATLHATDHRGYMQIAGYHWNTVGGQGATPEGLGDAARRNFTYYAEGGTSRIAPLSVALALNMGVKVPTNSRAAMEDYMNRDSFKKMFVCPSHEIQIRGLTQSDGGWSAPLEWMSYVFNEAFLGRREADKDVGKPCPRGNTSRVRRAAQVMLFGDGLPRGNAEGGWLTLPETGLDLTRATMYDYYQMYQASYKNFDLKRHHGKMNIVFVDGHADTFVIPNGLKGVGLTQGIYD